MYLKFREEAQKLEKTKFSRSERELAQRLKNVEENQTAMNSQISTIASTQAAMSNELKTISNALELLTSVLLEDVADADVKKGEKGNNNKCKNILPLKRKDDSNDDKGNEARKRITRTNVNVATNSEKGTGASSKPPKPTKRNSGSSSKLE